jgi:hypothetical protein
LQYLQRRRWPIPAWLRMQIQHLQSSREIGQNQNKPIKIFNGRMKMILT